MYFIEEYPKIVIAIVGSKPIVLAKLNSSITDSTVTIASITTELAKKRIEE